MFLKFPTIIRNHQIYTLLDILEVRSQTVPIFHRDCQKSDDIGLKC